MAFSAREDKKVDKRSGVSQRLPISTMELVVSNAERRALLHGEKLVVPRVSDLYAALPGITGKLELEYEGEMRGADVVVRELIRTAIGKIFDKYFSGTNTQQIEQWFNLGGTVRIDDDQPSARDSRRAEADSGSVCPAVAAVGQGLRRAGERSSRRGVSARRHVCPQTAEPQ